MYVYPIHTKSEVEPVAVCDTEEVAKELVELLKEESGRTHWFSCYEVCTNAPDFIDHW